MFSGLLLFLLLFRNECRQNQISACVSHWTDQKSVWFTCRVFFGFPSSFQSDRYNESSGCRPQLILTFNYLFCLVCIFCRWQFFFQTCSCPHAGTYQICSKCKQMDKTCRTNEAKKLKWASAPVELMCPQLLCACASEWVRDIVARAAVRFFPWLKFHFRKKIRSLLSCKNQNHKTAEI